MQYRQKVFSRGGICLFFLMCSLLPAAQQLNFRTFSHNEGLASGNIFNTVQDKYGFVWVATQDGLYRFNGTSFQQFKSNTAQGINTPGNAFTFAAFDNDNSIYAADFQQGIDIIRTDNLSVVPLNRKDPGYARLPDYWIWGILFDEQQNLWLRGESYLAVKKKTDKQFTILQSIPGFSGTAAPLFCKPISADKIAAGIPGYGAIIFDAVTLKQVQVLRTIIPASHPGINDIRDIALYHDTVFAATSNSIVCGTWKNKEWKFIREYRTPALQDALVSTMVFDQQGVLWIGTNNGLIRAEISKNLFTRYQTRPGQERWLADNTIQHLMIDREGNLWISTSNVLQVLNTRNNGFASYSGGINGDERIGHIYTIAKKNDTVFFATGTNGLFEVNVMNGRTRKISGTEKLGLVHHIELIEPGTWILSTDKGMYLYRAASGLLSQEAFLHKYPEWKPFVKNYFNTSWRQQENWYWASEETGGLLKWTPSQHHLQQFRAGTPNSRGLPENHLRNLKTDRDGYLWLLSDFTAARFDMSKDTVVSVIRKTDSTFNASLLFDFYDDGKIYWFATYGGGINGLQKKSGQWLYFSEKDGLSNNCVYGILPENDSIIWTTSNRGISRINTLSMRCSNYYYEDGLQDNTFEEKGTLTDSPHLYFGGIRGFTRLDPQQLSENTGAVPVFIHKIEYYTGDKHHTLHNLYWEKLVLPPGTNAVTIHLSALSFSGSNKYRFSYCIPGFQDQYIEADKANIISLAGLGPGTQKIQIRYRNKDGAYAEEKLELTFKIQPRWFQTLFFKIVVLLAAAGLAYIFYRMRISQFKKEEKIRSQLASDLHDDLGSTLNSIKVYSNLALMEKDNEEHLVRIKQGTQDAIAGVKDIIWVLDDQKDKLGDILERAAQFFLPLCKASRVQCSFAAGKEAGDIKLTKNEKRNLYMIIKESINNSLKYARCHTVSVTAEKKEKGLRLVIADDGIGFSRSQVPGGQGLKNMENRSAAIGWKAAIVSAAGEGTKIIIEKT